MNDSQTPTFTEVEQEIIRLFLDLPLSSKRKILRELQDAFEIHNDVINDTI